MLAKSRGLSRPVYVLLVLFILLMAAHISWLAPAADAMPVKACAKGNEWEEVKEKGADGAVVVFVCRCHRDSRGVVLWCGWEFSRLEPAKNDKYTEASRLSSDPPYRMRIETALGEGRGGGDAIGSIDMRNPNWTDLTRRVAVRTIMQYKPTATSGWLTCHDTGWKEAPTQRPRWSVWVPQWTQPDCGKGYYQAKVAGEFFAISKNAWIKSNWHYSGSIYMSGPCCVATTEPTTTPGPDVTGDP
jgi:hypothetical protein